MKDSRLIPFPDSRQDPQRRRRRAARSIALQVAELLQTIGLTPANLRALRDLCVTIRDLALSPESAAELVKVAAGKARWPILETELVYLRHLGISLDDEGEQEVRLLLQLAREARRAPRGGHRMGYVKAHV